MKNSLVIGQEKYINIKTAEGMGFRPVLSNLADTNHDDISAIDGYKIFQVECSICGKRYNHNQTTRQYRHYREHGGSK